MQSATLKPDLDALAAVDPQGLYLEALSSYPYMMTADDVAEFLGQTSQAVTQYLREGAMYGVKIGRSWRIPKRLLVVFLYENQNGVDA